MLLQAGIDAPQFELPDADMETFSLEEQRGKKNIVLYFGAMGEAKDGFDPTLLADPGTMMVARFYDPKAIGATFAYVLAGREQDRAMLRKDAFVNSMLRVQTFHTRLGDEDALAIRYRADLIIIPYRMTSEGLIFPWYTRIRVYPRFQKQAR